MVRDLHLDLTDAQWVTSLYSVVFAALLLPAGRFGDLRGRRKLLLGGLALFVGGSILAALATSAGTLLAARAVQGIGGAAVLPSTLSTVNATFRGRDRAAAFGIWGAVMSGAAAAGPLVGGWLTQVSGWPLVFWVIVPIGVAVMALALKYVDENHGSDEPGNPTGTGATTSTSSAPSSAPRPSACSSSPSSKAVRSGGGPSRSRCPCSV